MIRNINDVFIRIKYFIIVIVMITFCIVRTYANNNLITELISDPFSNIYVTFSDISVYNLDTNEWIKTNANPRSVDLKVLSDSSVVDVVGVNSIKFGNYSKVRYIIQDVIGKLKNSDQQIVLEIPNNIKEINYNFTVSQDELVFLKAKFDVYNSIKNTVFGYEFVPSIIEITKEIHSFDLQINPAELTAKLGDKVSYAVTIFNKGTMEDIYKLNLISDIPSEWIGLPDTVVVPAGSTKNIIFEIDIPETFTESITYPITLQASIIYPFIYEFPVGFSSYAAKHNVSLIINESPVIDDSVGTWHFDECSGIVAEDTSNNNNGTLVNNPVRVNGIIGKALEFDGTNKYVSISDNNSLDITNAITLEAWVKSDRITQDNGPTRRIIDKGVYILAASDKAYFKIYVNCVSKSVEKSWTCSDTGVWHHLVGTYDSAGGCNNMKLYQDGVLMAQTTVTGKIDTNSSILNIGRQGPTTGRFDGIIDEVKIYNRALTAEEVVEHYQSTLSDNTPPKSQLQVVGSKYQVGNKIYISTNSKITIIAEDDLSINGVVSGVKEIYYSIDSTSTYSLYSSTPPAGGLPIYPSLGTYTIRYYAIDQSDNTEKLNTMMIVVTTVTIQDIEIKIGEPKYEAFGRTIISPKTPLTLVTEGVKTQDIEYRINSSTSSGQDGWNIYITTFTLPEGVNTIEYRNINNIKEAKVSTFTVTYISEYAAYGKWGIALYDTAQIYGDVKSYLNVKLYNESKIIGNAEGKPVNLCGCSKVTGNIIYSTVTINSNIIDLSAIESEVANNNDNFKIPLTIAGNQALVNGVLTINSNDTLTISTGTYYFNGIKLSANSKLYFKGRIRIYSKGKISIPDESEVHSNGSPNNLIIYCNTSQAVHLNGSGELQGIVYAPTSDIAVCGTNITVCNVFGKSVYMNGANKIVGVKYDGQPSQLLASSKRLAPSDVFVKGEVYAYPNPAKNGYQPTIHMECGIADYVEIYIYNIAGELVQSDKIYTQPIIKNNKYAYEYMWDVSNKASGIYLYLVRAHKDGEKTIKVLKKVAIIK
ncbi:MAG: hypothetical protein A2539_06405 [Elusimicrobia bacterium RIFOXYD2_FULL_34_15]|nr:MAG: hypothetical protein A2539_06405 [Elusimicrobia bacterium RIFOXYD2_FULL_34_15]HAM38460.1 hypothetical protein [Elusimicrobiota bacterium]